MHDFTEIDRMTMYEYCVRMKSHRLQQVDHEYMLHLLAWQSWDVQAMKKQGRKRVPVYKNFSQFFDTMKSGRSDDWKTGKVPWNWQTSDAGGKNAEGKEEKGWKAIVYRRS